MSSLFFGFCFFFFFNDGGARAWLLAESEFIPIAIQSINQSINQSISQL